MNDNPFVLPTDAYARDIDVLRHYMHDQATYLQLMTHAPIDECLAFVRQSLKPGGQFEFKDPEVYYLERNEHGDREKKTTTLSQYLGTSVRSRELIAPTFTTYLPASVKPSLLADYIDGNVKARSKAKKAMFAAKMAGDKTTETFKKGEQTNRKLSNNAISGAHVSASTPIYNPTGHSTLTSNCRSTAGYGNANNEKFLCGNRHYWCPDTVRNNIVSIVRHTDYPTLSQALREFGIRCPTVEETIECIEYSTRLYWTSEIEWARLRELVGNLNELQRAAFVYTGDLYHLMKYNDAVVRNFITELSSYVPTPHPDPQSVFDKAPEDHMHLAVTLCPEEMRGKALRDLKGTVAEAVYASNVEHINTVLQKHRVLIRALWVTPNVPASVAYFPDSVRRAAITSDTDSTIFTVQDWVVWYCGSMKFDREGCAVATTMIFLASATITHVLARMSANFGIETKRLHQIAMKNEFYFPVFVPTQVAKHYYALIAAQEGNLFDEFDVEIKGVHLKSSNAPKIVTQEAKKMMLHIMNSVVEGKKVSLGHLLTWIANIERQVMDSIKQGSFEYFRKGQIKTPPSYTKGPEESPYATYTMWEEVFAPKYGSTTPPPYASVKVSTGLNSPAKAKDWLASIEDRALAERMIKYMERTGKQHLGATFMLPEQIIASKGIPKEIFDAIGVRKIILDTTGVLYLICESLGYFMLTDKGTRLASDYY